MSQGYVPLYHVTVVERTTYAVNYRPRHGETRLDFIGTTLLPGARGFAKIRGEKGHVDLEADFHDLEPATVFGPEYLTYVLWAITPEGRASNLGELQVKGHEDELHVTTELQAFALLVTAEPYFAVTQPSDVVVLENVVRPNDTNGRVESVQAKYELLQRGTYLMDRMAPVTMKALAPGVPLDLAEARNAVALAQLAGADQFAADTFAKASMLLAEAEHARTRHEERNQVMMPARQAVQTAEDARLIALQRQEAYYQAQQQALAARRESEAYARAHAEAAQRELAEQERAAADAARAAAERARLDAEQARAGADSARQAADAARAAAETRMQQAQDAAAQAEREKTELRAQLRQQLNVILETRETARGLIVNLSDVLFDTASADLRPDAREKLARVAGILETRPDLHIEVEGFTDNVGGEDYNQRLSERRAGSVRRYLVQQGVAPEAVSTVGYGESQPVATNGTAAGRQRNRRVELVVSGNSIGTPSRSNGVPAQPGTGR
jgi:outer membrane protein OmpA-like peptidoglycan-associated protein